VTTYSDIPVTSQFVSWLNCQRQSLTVSLQLSWPHSLAALLLASHVAQPSGRAFYTVYADDIWKFQWVAAVSAVISSSVRASSLLSQLRG